MRWLPAPFIIKKNQYQVEAKSFTPYKWAPGAKGASGATGYLVKEDSRFLFDTEDDDVSRA
jgi:hypothetical protein